MNRVKLVLVTLFCTLFYSLPSMSTEKLPYISLHGQIEMYSQINVKLVLISTNRTNNSCYSTNYIWGNSFLNAHTYTLAANAFADYYGIYYIDIYVDGRFSSYLRSLIKDGKIKFSSLLSVSNYLQLCQFELKTIEYNANDTFLVLGNKQDANFQSILNLSKGSTDSFSFNFSATDHIRLEINVKEGSL